MLLYTLDVHAESATPYVRALPASPDSARGRALDAAINEQRLVVIGCQPGSNPRLEREWILRDREMTGLRTRAAAASTA